MRKSVDLLCEAGYPPSQPVQDMLDCIMTTINEHTKDDPRGIDGDVAINALLASMGVIAVACDDPVERARICAAIHHFVDYEIPADHRLVARFRTAMRRVQRLADRATEGHA
jgi:hypothetical protein